MELPGIAGPEDSEESDTQTVKKIFRRKSFNRWDGTGDTRVEGTMLLGGIRWSRVDSKSTPRTVWTRLYGVYCPHHIVHSVLRRLPSHPGQPRHAVLQVQTARV